MNDYTPANKLSTVDDVEMESQMLDLSTNSSILRRKNRWLEQKFLFLCILCGILGFTLIVVAAVLASEKCKTHWDDVPNASFCQSLITNANAGNYGGRIDLHNSWSLPPSCYEYVRAYMKNQYNEDIQGAIDAAKTQLTIILGESACQATSQCLVILDIDETSLSNYPHINEVDFGFNPIEWNKWLAKASAPAILPTLNLYKNMTSQGVNVAFITGRSNQFHNETEKNLKNVGYTGFLELITKPPGNETAVEYKTKNREKLVHTYNLTIIGSIGDQWSDIMGEDLGPTIYTTKLQNPLYYVQ